MAAQVQVMLYTLSERLIIAEWVLHSLGAGLETD